MAFYLSPLVDVNEIDLTTTVPAVATSIACCVLRRTFKGPEKKRTLVTNIDELTTMFGYPTDNSYKDMLSATGYLKYGNKLWCTRTMPVDAKFAGCFGPATSASTLTGYGTSAYQLNDFSSEDPDVIQDESLFSTAPLSADSDNAITFIASSRGAWGNKIKVAVIDGTTYSAVTSAAAGNPSTEYSSTNVNLELYRDIVDLDYPVESAREFIVLVRAADQDDFNKATIPYTLKEVFYVSSDENKLDDEGDNIYCENVINTKSKYIRIAVDPANFKNSDITINTGQYYAMTGGTDSSFADDDAEDTAGIAAFELYEDPDVIDVNIFIDSDSNVTVKREIIDICETRKDAMAVLDVLKADVVNNDGNEVTDLRDYRLSTLNENTSYASLYGNWLDVFDTWNSKYRWIPASGHMAGIYARTDDLADPWFAPAGLNRSILTNIRKLAFNPTLGERDILYKNGINPIAAFAGQGKVVWGQKTMLDKSSAFNRINVRRLFMVMEKAISTASKYFLFEPNDEFTRLSIINMVEPFLRDVRGRRGIYDFMVVCDERNNTAERIDRQELWVDIYIKPVRAAEFIVLNFVATKTGASFTELVAQTTSGL